MSEMRSLPDGDGFFVVGQLVGVERASTFTDRESGEERTRRPVIKLLVGSTMHRIRARSQDEIDSVLGLAQRLDRVVVPVFLNGPFDEVTNRPRAHNASFSVRAPRDEGSPAFGAVDVRSSVA